MNRMTGVVLWEKKAAMEDEQFMPQGLGYRPEGLLEVTMPFTRVNHDIYDKLTDWIWVLKKKVA